MKKDLSDRPLEAIYVTDFNLSHSPYLITDDRSVVSDLTHLTMSNETLVSQVQDEPPVISKPPVRTDYVDKRSSNSRPGQANHKSSVINKHYDNVINQQKREEESEEEGNISRYRGIHSSDG